MDEQQSIYTVSAKVLPVYLTNSNRKMRFTKFYAQYRGNTALKSTVPAVLPQPLSPLPWYYRSSGFHYRGYCGITVVPITVQVSSPEYFALRVLF